MFKARWWQFPTSRPRIQPSRPDPCGYPWSDKQMGVGVLFASPQCFNPAPTLIIVVDILFVYIHTDYICFAIIRVKYWIIDHHLTSLFSLFLSFNSHHSSKSCFLYQNTLKRTKLLTITTVNRTQLFPDLGHLPNFSPVPLCTDKEPGRVPGTGDCKSDSDPPHCHPRGRYTASIWKTHQMSSDHLFTFNQTHPKTSSWT